VTIEKLAGFDSDYAFEGDDGSRGTTSQFLPKPMFRLGFAVDEAKHFQGVWSNPPLDTPEKPANFYFLIFGKDDKMLRDAGLFLGELLVPVV
jgi:hypothetical protein